MAVHTNPSAPPTVPTPPVPLRRDGITLFAAALLIVGSAVLIGKAADAVTVYLAFHVALAVVWVGGGVALGILGALTEKARDEDAMANLVAQVAKIGLWIFTPASLLTLASGIAIMAASDVFSYSEFWIVFALVVWALSFFTGLLFLGPTSARLARLIPERGLRDPATERSVAVLLRVARVDSAMLVLVVLDMVVRPTF